MQYVPICPTALVPKMAEIYPWHFCLTHMLRSDEKYFEAYCELTTSYPSLELIMDNGAFEEGKSDSIEDIIELVEKIHPTEIILPDRMFFADETVRMTSNAIKALKSHSWKREPPRLMGVAHGRNFREWYECMMWMVGHEDIDVLGIPKDYEAWDGGRKLLLAMVPDCDIKIHFLGWEKDAHTLSRRRLGEELFDRIRTVDTAKPFAKAIRGDTSFDPYKGRPGNFFSFEHEDKFRSEYEALLKDNLGLYDGVAQSPINGGINL